MYKKDRNRQYCITDFDQPMGMKLDTENRWVKKSETIPWNDIEDRYAELFPSNTGMPAKPLRMALGSLLIQKKLGFSDRDLVAEITENPYLQYFIGLPAYQNKAPFAPSLLVEFRKRLTEEILGEINEMIMDFNIEKAAPDDTDDGNSNGHDSGNDKADNAEVEEKSMKECKARLSESCEMQKTYKEKDQKSDQTAAAVCKAGSEICERVSGVGERPSGKTTGKTWCDRKSI